MASLTETSNENSKKSNETLDPRLKNALIHSAGVGAGWFALALLARQLLDQKHALERKQYEKELTSAINARYPVLEPRFGGDGEELEESLRQAGVPKVKAMPGLKEASAIGDIASDVGDKLEDVKDAAESKIGDIKDATVDKAKDIGSEVKHGVAKLLKLVVKRSKMHKDAADNSDNESVARKLTDRFINPLPVQPGPIGLSNIIGSVGNPKVHPAHVVMTLAALLGGGMAGWALSGHLTENAYKRQLDERAKHTRSKIDQLLAEEYARTRGMTKLLRKGRAPEAVDGSISDQFYDLTPEDKVEQHHEGVEERTLEKNAEERTTTGNVVRAIPKMYLLYAALASTLAAGVAKSYMDARDPARARHKMLATYARDRARMKDAPILIKDPMHELVDTAATEYGKPISQAVNMPSGLSGAQVLSL